MATVIHRVSKKLIESAHTPDYENGEWIVKPDLSLVTGCPQKYWKIENDSVLPMTEEERAAVDALEPDRERDEPIAVYEDRTFEEILKIKKPKKMAKAFATDFGMTLTFDGEQWVTDGAIKEINTEKTAMTMGDIVAFKGAEKGVCFTTDKNNKDIAGCVLVGAEPGQLVVIKIGGVFLAKINGACLAMDFINPSTTPGVGAAQTNQTKGSFAKVLEKKTSVGIELTRCISVMANAASYGAK